jgi:hypothetical protein
MLCHRPLLGGIAPPFRVWVLLHRPPPTGQFPRVR